ncbi:MAG: cell division protein FtsZ [Pseudomonadota bacterium]
MAIELTRSELLELHPKITVIGVGGAGGNAVNNMIDAKLLGVDFVSANTDAQALAASKAEQRIQLGAQITQGLGAGSRPEIGESAAEEATAQIEEQLKGSHMVFITAGMGGGTGTGAAPVIARLAREQGILTVGVVTKPFHFEGSKRMKSALSGIAELQKHVDTLIIIPNQNLFRIANERMSFSEAFSHADEVLQSGVRGITDLMVVPGIVNLDFADVRTVMSEMGKAMMGTGEAEGERRAIDAAEAAIANPLLDDVSLQGATGVIVNVTAGHDLSLFEVDEAINHIREQVDPEANIIFGSAIQENMEGRVRISVVATGIESEADSAPRPQQATAATGAFHGGVSAAVKPAATQMPQAVKPVPSTPAAPVEEVEVAAHTTKAPTDPAPVLSIADEFAASVEQEDEPVPERAPVVDIKERPFYAPPAASTSQRPRMTADRPAPKATPSLFERLTGARNTAEAKSEAAQQSEGESTSYPKFGGDAATNAERREPRFGNGNEPLELDVEVDENESDDQNDPFEIPTFLRRQVN